MLTSANSDLKRAKDLLVKQAGTQQTLDTATAAQLSSTAQISADQAAIEADTIQLGFATIKSPIEGRLGAVQVAIGDLVGGSSSSATPLVTLPHMTPVDATFNLPESDLALARQTLSEGKTDNVSIRINGSDQEVAKGTLYFVDSSVDVGSGTIQAKATIPNADFKLWPGQYVNVQLDAGTLPTMVSIPAVAVQAGQKGPFVYLVKDGKSVEVRQIKVALTVGENSAIADGLAEGDQVVTDGQAQLKNGAAVKIGKSQDAAPAKANGGDALKPAASSGKSASNELAFAP